MNIKEIRDVEEMLDGLEDKADEILIWVRAKRDEIEEIKAQKILRGNVIPMEVRNAKSC